MLSLNIPLTFKSVVQASTSRFVDIDAQSLAALRDGQPIYIESIRRNFRWDSSSTATQDNTTAGTVLQPTVVAGAGRAIWDGKANQAWGTQIDWYVASTGNYENPGTLVAPLATAAELSRRTRDQQWRAGTYNLYLLNSIASPDELRLSGYRPKTSTIWVHGSQTPGQAPAANRLFTSVTGYTARVVQNRATNTRTEISVGDAGFDWSTSGTGATSLISSSATPNKRLRFTSGAESGAVQFAQFRVSATNARISTTFAALSTMTGPPASLQPAQDTIPGAAQFVVESLITLDLLVVDLTDDDDQTTNPSGFGLLFDSIAFVTRHVSAVAIAYWGCVNVSRGSNANASGPASSLPGPERTRAIASHTAGGAVARGSWMQYFGCHQTTQTFTGSAGGNLLLDADHIAEGIDAVNTLGGLAFCVGLCAAFNSTGNAFNAAAGGIMLGEGVQAVYGVAMWGAGGAGAGVGYTINAIHNYNLVPTVTGATGDRSIAGVAAPWSQGSVIDMANGIRSIKQGAPPLVLADGNGGAAKTVSFALFTEHTLTLTAAVCVLTLTAPSMPGLVRIVIGFDATAARAITWPAAVLWPGGVAPVLTDVAGKRDFVELYWDGTNYFGRFALNY